MGLYKSFYFLLLTNQSKPPVCSTNHEEGKVSTWLTRVFPRLALVASFCFSFVSTQFSDDHANVYREDQSYYFYHGLKLRINVCLVLAKVVSTFVLFFFRDSYQHRLLLSFINRRHDRRV